MPPIGTEWVDGARHSDGETCKAGDGEAEEKIDGVEAFAHRTVAANGVGRPDLQFGAHEACKRMASPDASDQRRVKRIARYIQAVPRVVITKGGDLEGESATSACVDFGWAGCRRIRKSTSGCVLKVAGMAIKT